MTDRRLMADLTDDRLGLALQELSAFVAIPSRGGPSADPARRARLRIEQRASRPARSWLGSLHVPRLGRGLVFALIAVLAIAVAAAAVGLGLPGIRFVPAPSEGPSASPSRAATSGSPSPRTTPTTAATGPLGFDLGLGDPIAVADVKTTADFAVILPPAETVGPPSTAWLLDGRLALIWPASSSLPVTQSPGIVTDPRGVPRSVDEGYFAKVIEQGTVVTTIQIDGNAGYWISGQPHEIVYVNPHGDPVFDSRRSVGDTLLWARDGITYRLETGLGQEGAIGLAESLR